MADPLQPKRPAAHSHALPCREHSELGRWGRELAREVPQRATASWCWAGKGNCCSIEAEQRGKEENSPCHHSWPQHGPVSRSHLTPATATHAHLVATKSTGLRLDWRSLTRARRAWATAAITGLASPWSSYQTNDEKNRQKKSCSSLVNARERQFHCNNDLHLGLRDKPIQIIEQQKRRCACNALPVSMFEDATSRRQARQMAMTKRTSLATARSLSTETSARLPASDAQDTARACTWCRAA
jgi:hypothetical protein